MILLFLMLVAFTIALLGFRWKLKKALGVVLLVFYVIFVAISLAFTYNFVLCPVGPA